MYESASKISFVGLKNVKLDIFFQILHIRWTLLRWITREKAQLTSL